MLAQEIFPEVHPLKGKFHQFGITHVAIRNYLRQHLKIQISTSRVNQFLNGYDQPPPVVESALSDLSQELDKKQRGQFS